MFLGFHFCLIFAAGKGSLNPPKTKKGNFIQPKASSVRTTASTKRGSLKDRRAATQRKYRQNQKAEAEAERHPEALATEQHDPHFDRKNVQARDRRAENTRDQLRETKSRLRAMEGVVESLTARLQISEQQCSEMEARNGTS